MLLGTIDVITFPTAIQASAVFQGESDLNGGIYFFPMPGHMDEISHLAEN
jgi:hypothetical protein